MRSAYIITYIVYTIVSIFIVSRILLGYLSFGYGLGDIMYLIITAILWVIITILVLINRKTVKISSLAILTLTMIICIIFLISKITIFRGPEYRWNGDLFHTVNLKAFPDSDSPALFDEI